MDSNITYYYDSLIFCPKCHCLFKINNYNKHIMTRKHFYNASKKKYKNEDFIKTGNYKICFN